MTRRHLGLYFFFGLPIAGALAGSYLHLAAWLRPWMPPGWERLSWVAALALDGLILAPIMARQIVGADVSGAALRLAQGAGIGASVYVNARWGYATMAPDSKWELADVAVGAAILPLLALIGEHAMRSTLVALQRSRGGTRSVPLSRSLLLANIARAREARRSMAPTPWPVPGRRAADAAAATERKACVPSTPRRSGGTRANRPEWRELVARHGDNPRAIANATGTPLRTVQRWRQQATAQ